MHRFYKEISRGYIDVLDEQVAEDYIDHYPPTFPVAPGREGLKQAFNYSGKPRPATIGSKTKWLKATNARGPSGPTSL